MKRWADFEEFQGTVWEVLTKADVEIPEEYLIRHVALENKGHPKVITFPHEQY